jgi:hypothetical protein
MASKNKKYVVEVTEDAGAPYLENGILCFPNPVGFLEVKPRVVEVKHTLNGEVYQA